jgi:hypothetical protein
MKLSMKTKRTILSPLAIFALACFALLPGAHAVSPAPDGGYPGASTPEGEDALLSLTTGGYNTAVGFGSLRSDTTGQFNTGVGAVTLCFNTGDQNTANGAGPLTEDTTGNIVDGNTAVGGGALEANTTGLENAAVDENALMGIFAENRINFKPALFATLCERILFSACSQVVAPRRTTSHD